MDKTKLIYQKQHSFIFNTIILCIIVFSLPLNIVAQNKDNSILADREIIGSDTIYTVHLAEIKIIPDFKFKNKRQKRRYSKLVRNIKKVYPYAQLAKKTLDQIETTVDSLDNKKLAKRYIKELDKSMKKRYGKELKALTITQGRLLIKLIDRETGYTSYELIKELKGGFSAFMWQGIARLFGENLKEQYDAKEDDKMIEHIILCLENGQL